MLAWREASRKHQIPRSGAMQAAMSCHTWVLLTQVLGTKPQSSVGIAMPFLTTEPSLRPCFFFSYTLYSLLPRVALFTTGWALLRHPSIRKSPSSTTAGHSCEGVLLVKISSLQMTFIVLSWPIKSYSCDLKISSFNNPSLLFPTIITSFLSFLSFIPVPVIPFLSCIVSLRKAIDQLI